MLIGRIAVEDNYNSYFTLFEVDNRAYITYRSEGRRSVHDGDMDRGLSTEK